MKRQVGRLVLQPPRPSFGLRTRRMIFEHVLAHHGASRTKRPTLHASSSFIRHS